MKLTIAQRIRMRWGMKWAVINWYEIALIAAVIIIAFLMVAEMVSRYREAIDTVRNNQAQTQQRVEQTVVAMLNGNLTAKYIDQQTGDRVVTYCDPKELKLIGRM